MPTLPGLSLLLDDENKVPKLEPTSKVEPKKSFQQWKQQHKDKFNDNSTAQQRKPEKKQVRFETDHRTSCNFTENLSNQRTPPPVSPNLELSYYEVPVTQAKNYCQNQELKEQHQQQYIHHNSKLTGHLAGHNEGFEKSILHSRCNSNSPSTPPFVCDKAYNAANEHQATIDFSQFNRAIRSESMKENCFSTAALAVHNQQQDYHNNCCRQGCQTNQNRWQMVDNSAMQPNGCKNHPKTLNRQICNHGTQPNGCMNDQLEHPSQQQELLVEQRNLNRVGGHLDRHSKEQFTDDMLLSIMEEQQQHILLQQSQILMQQKQNMMQQNQIFMLQQQVQQLLVGKGIVTNESPSKKRQSTLCEKMTPSPLQNRMKIPSTSAESVCNGTTARSSIGVMTSFLDNVNDGIPNGIQKFNERFKSTSKLANEKFIENIGGMAEEYSYKDSMLDKINDAIKNSSAMIEYRTNGTANGCISPNRQSDINIAAQA